MAVAITNGKSRERFFFDVKDTTDVVYAIGHAAAMRREDMIKFFGAPWAYCITKVDAVLTSDRVVHVALLAERRES